MKAVHISKADKGINAVIFALAVLAFLLAAYPLYFIFIASFSSPAAISTGRVTFFPKEVTFAAYRYILQEKALWLGYANTIFYTIASVVFGLAVTIPAGYALSRKDMVGRKSTMLLLTFTMFFNGGLIPTYLVVSNLNMLNTRAVLIILNCITVFNIIVVRTFFSNSIPSELFEAASIDGCGNTHFFFSIVIPISKTIIAVIALYIAVWQWNAFFNALIYTSKPEIQTLQLVIRNLLLQGQNLSAAEGLDGEALKAMQETAQLMKYGVIVVSTLPIICAYPFAQKYFVKGVMIGSVKG